MTARSSHFSDQGPHPELRAILSTLYGLTMAVLASYTKRSTESAVLMIIVALKNAGAHSRQAIRGPFSIAFLAVRPRCHSVDSVIPHGMRWGGCNDKSQRFRLFGRRELRRLRLGVRVHDPVV